MWQVGVKITDEEYGKLVESAKNSTDYKEWSSGIGWADWMSNFTEAGDGEEPDESEVKEIEEVLQKAWQDAHA